MLTSLAQQFIIMGKQETTIEHVDALKWMMLFVPGLSKIARIHPCCPVCCVVLFQPRACHISYWHLSTLALTALFVFFSSVCPRLSFFSLLIHPHHMAVPLNWVVFLVFLDTFTTLVVPLMCSFRIVSLLVTSHMYLSILISFTSSSASCPLDIVLVAAQYNIAGLTNIYLLFSQRWSSGRSFRETQRKLDGGGIQRNRRILLTDDLTVRWRHLRHNKQFPV